jgi:hypothetical protein
VKQLKRSGFKENILINTYKSFVLSHFNYSSPVLATTSEATKLEMSQFQRRVLRIINITPERALTQYGIIDIDAQIEKASTATITRILSNPEHPLTKKLTRNTRSCFTEKFKIPRVRNTKFYNNTVNKVLRKHRDQVAELYTTGSQTRITRERPAPTMPTESAKPMTACQYCGVLYTRPKTHEIYCKRRQTAAAAPAAIQ